ncbi:hypothetical protein UMM65_10115 [Aureibaculum sp. 2210JD6-5]|uniref:hypothetical protein n=1 Tax=Aureibaculum sp. 2210JD6-5 TaxID=3103957 RepID=UPI002AACCB5E|nr:hypothetical protein [Aureibaculum sp. 2210JD6-5]MDY7395597.1 hypothetical protein [Aureibaculum sp. 2210JD6-5]
MKTQLLKIVLFLLCIPLAVQANENKGHKHEKTKTIKKEYTVNSNALLKIDNKYGNIDVVSWNGNKVEIEVKITVSGNDEDKVIKRLSMIDVEFEGSRSEVSAKTIIEKKSSSWCWGCGKDNNIHYQINYKVKVPVTNHTDLRNDYGNITLNETKGDCSINCDYGSIIIGDLHSNNNSINIDYTNNSTIGLMNGGSINADYSKITVEKAGKIDLNADYTTTVFEDVKNLDYNCDYGSLKIDKAVNVVGNGDYLSLKMGTISKKAMVEADYGAIKIEKLLDGFDLVEIDGSYTGIKIGVPKNKGFNFDIKLSHGGFKYDDDMVNFTSKVVKSSSKSYQGSYGKSNSNSTIKIDSGYGSVTFY